MRKENIIVHKYPYPVNVTIQDKKVIAIREFGETDVRVVYIPWMKEISGYGWLFKTFVLEKSIGKDAMGDDIWEKVDSIQIDYAVEDDNGTIVLTSCGESTSNSETDMWVYLFINEVINNTKLEDFVIERIPDAERVKTFDEIVCDF